MILYNLCFPYLTLSRGGGEQGLSWHRQACVEGKQRSVEDLEACLHQLFSAAVSSPSLTALTACSAGAVPVGALCNRSPHMVRAVTLQVETINYSIYFCLVQQSVAFSAIVYLKRKMSDDFSCCLKMKHVCIN